MNLTHTIRQNLVAGSTAIALISATHAQFTEVAELSGIDYVQMLDFEKPPVGDVPYESQTHMMTGGCAAGDFDNDGWVDLFVTRVGALPILYRNTGGDEGSTLVGFEDVSASAGINGDYHSNGAAWGDIDNDGDLDLYVSTIYESRFRLYVNNGDGTFSEEALSRGADLTSDTLHYGFSVSFGDYDNDGWLDIHTAEWGIDRAINTPERHSTLLRNLGPENPGRFENVTISAGVLPRGSEETVGSETFFYLYGLTSRFDDLDNDGWQDLLYVADFGASQLFWNNGDGTFTEADPNTGVALEHAGMGSHVGDFNNDGHLDWYVSSIFDNRLYENLQNRTFNDVAPTAGDKINGINHDLTDGGWSWGCSFIDYDNDGYQDLVVANGFQDKFDWVQHPVIDDETEIWKNLGDSFFRVGEDLGVNSPHPGKGLLVFDYDNDGDQDFFIANCQGKPELYRNDTPTANKSLRIALRGKVSNYQGIGSRIELMRTNTPEINVSSVSASSNYLGQSETVVHFGLGDKTDTGDVLSIAWPSGRTQVIYGIPETNELLIEEPLSWQEWENLNTLPIGEPNGDFDQDGSSNIEEFIADTDPRDAADQPDGPIFGPGIRLPEEGKAVIQVEYPISLYDVSLKTMVSSDLENWIDVNELNPLRIGGSYNNKSNKMELQIDWNEEKLFVRVHATSGE